MIHFLNMPLNLSPLQSHSLWLCTWIEITGRLTDHLVIIMHILQDSDFLFSCLGRVNNLLVNTPNKMSFVVSRTEVYCTKQWISGDTKQS